MKVDIPKGIMPTRRRIKPKVFRVPNIRLPERLRRVLSLIADGLTSPEIARRLGVSPGAVRSDRRRLLKIIGVKGTARLVHFAVGTGVTGLPSKKGRNTRRRSSPSKA
jgi:DNA-binding CsgD family transcriptional regulator